MCLKMMNLYTFGDLPKGSLPQSVEPKAAAGGTGCIYRCFRLPTLRGTLWIGVMM